jgi:hypothetical protein
MNDLEHTGAIDYVTVEFPRQHVTGELIPSLIDLVDRRIIRILDALIVVKHDDGSHEVLRPDDVDPAIAEDVAELTGASSGLLGVDDANEIAAIMQTGTGSLTIVYENLWSLPFATAAREAGGQLISSGHIPTQAIVAALDTLEA